MTNSSHFLEKSQINNFDEIIKAINDNGISPGTIGMEHIGDIINYLDKWDKERHPEDPELKKATFTVIKTLIDSGIAEARWGDTWADSSRTTPPTEEEVFECLNKYWNLPEPSGLDRNYLIYFRRKGQTWP